MTKPIRIQRKRVKGWKMPENTVYVGRPTKFGNPFKPNEGGIEGAISAYRAWLDGKYYPPFSPLPPPKQEIQALLKGKNLACFCPLDKPCHADILLELANA